MAGRQRHVHRILLPDDPTARSITETTFVLEKKLTDNSACSPNMSATIRKAPARAISGIPARSITSTGPSRSTFTSRFGLNHNAPDYIVGVGYSFRIDGLFGETVR